MKFKISSIDVSSAIGLMGSSKRDELLNKLVKENNDINEIKSETEEEGYQRRTKANAVNSYVERYSQVESKELVIHKLYPWLIVKEALLVDTDSLLVISIPYDKRLGSSFDSISKQLHKYIQLQIELFVTGREKAYFYQYSEYGYKIEVMAYDPVCLNHYLPLLLDFYNDVKKEIQNEVYKQISEQEASEGLNELSSKEMIQEFFRLKAQQETIQERLKAVQGKLIKLGSNRLMN